MDTNYKTVMNKVSCPAQQNTCLDTVNSSVISIEYVHFVCAWSGFFLFVCLFESKLSQGSTIKQTATRVNLQQKRGTVFPLMLDHLHAVPCFLSFLLKEDLQKDKPYWAYVCVCVMKTSNNCNATFISNSLFFVFKFCSPVIHQSLKL